jgi:hypothetical protein
VPIVPRRLILLGALLVVVSACTGGNYIVPPVFPSSNCATCTTDYKR